MRYMEKRNKARCSRDILHLADTAPSRIAFVFTFRTKRENLEGQSEIHHMHHRLMNNMLSKCSCCPLCEITSAADCRLHGHTHPIRLRPLGCPPRGSRPPLSVCPRRGPWAVQAARPLRSVAAGRGARGAALALGRSPAGRASEERRGEAAGTSSTCRRRVPRQPAICIIAGRTPLAGFIHDLSTGRAQIMLG